MRCRQCAAVVPIDVSISLHRPRQSEPTHSGGVSGAVGRDLDETAELEERDRLELERTRPGGAAGKRAPVRKVQLTKRVVKTPVGSEASGGSGDSKRPPSGEKRVAKRGGVKKKGAASKTRKSRRPDGEASAAPRRRKAPKRGTAAPGRARASGKTIGRGKKAVPARPRAIVDDTDLEAGDGLFDETPERSGKGRVVLLALLGLLLVGGGLWAAWHFGLLDGLTGSGSRVADSGGGASSSKTVSSTKLAADVDEETEEDADSGDADDVSPEDLLARLPDPVPLVELLPAGCEAVCWIDPVKLGRLEKLIASLGEEDATGMVPTDAVGGVTSDLEAFFRAADIDPREDVESVVLALRALPTTTEVDESEPPDLLLILEGEFDAVDAATGLIEERGLSEAEDFAEGPRTVRDLLFTPIEMTSEDSADDEDPADDGEDSSTIDDPSAVMDAAWLVVLAENRLGIVTEAMVDSIADLAHGDGPSVVSNEELSLLSSGFKNVAAVSLAVQISAELRGKLEASAEGTPMATMTPALSGVHLALDGDEERGVAVGLDFQAPEKADAGQNVQKLRMLLGMGRMFLGQSPFASLLGKIQPAPHPRDERMTRIAFELTPAEIVGALNAPPGGGSPPGVGDVAVGDDEDWPDEDHAGDLAIDGSDDTAMSDDDDLDAELEDDLDAELEDDLDGDPEGDIEDPDDEGSSEAGDGDSSDGDSSDEDIDEDDLPDLDDI